MAYFEEKQVFDEDEIRVIFKEREQQEYRLMKNSAAKLDFLIAI